MASRHGLTELLVYIAPQDARSDIPDRAEFAAPFVCPPAPTPAPTEPEPWDAAALTARSENNADNCFVAIFGAACSAQQGGVYKITASWYTGHFGGPFGSKRGGAGTCGNIIEDWFGRSGSHSQYGTNLVRLRLCCRRQPHPLVCRGDNLGRWWPWPAGTV